MDNWLFQLNQLGKHAIARVTYRRPTQNKVLLKYTTTKYTFAYKVTGHQGAIQIQ